MFITRKPCAAFFFAFALVILPAPFTRAQDVGQIVYHRLEGRVQFRTSGVGNVRVRLSRDMRPVGETFTRPEGQFTFNTLIEGDYQVETFETERYEATLTNVTIRPIVRQKSDIFSVFIELPLKTPSDKVAPGVVAADVDLNVPNSALKHYRSGMKALDESDSTRAIKELQAAVVSYPNYYAARLELGRELRKQKKFQEAEEVLRPLAQIAPRRAEARTEHAISLLSLGRREDAVKKLEDALRMQEANWTAHLFLGWALLEKEGEKAAIHFKRALALEEQKAARAHLALARLAEEKGQRQLALAHLDAYLVIAPDAHDAEAARRLAARLRSEK